MKTINLEEKEIFDILVALKQRRASCQTIADDSAGCSLDYDISDPYRKHYNDRFVAYSAKAKNLTEVIAKFENL